MASRKQKETEKTSVAFEDTKPLGTIENYAGLSLSLNMKKGSFFSIGEPGKPMQFKLTPDDWHRVVPKGLSDMESAQITQALNSGRVKIGQVLMPPIVKDASVIVKYMNIMKQSATLTEEIKETFRTLVAFGKEGGYTALEILNECLEYAQKYRKGTPWVSFIDAGIDAYEGPDQLVQDFPDDPGNYEVVIDRSEGKIIKDSSRPDNEIRATTNTIVPSVPDRVAEAELDKFLG
jgi:hypothetical protein